MISPEITIENEITNETTEEKLPKKLVPIERTGELNQPTPSQDGKILATSRIDNDTNTRKIAFNNLLKFNPETCNTYS